MRCFYFCEAPSPKKFVHFASTYAGGCIHRSQAITKWNQILEECKAGQDKDPQMGLIDYKGPGPTPELKIRCRVPTVTKINYRNSTMSKSKTILSGEAVKKPTADHIEKMKKQVMNQASGFALGSEDLRKAASQVQAGASWSSCSRWHSQAHRERRRTRCTS